MWSKLNKSFTLAVLLLVLAIPVLAAPHDIVAWDFEDPLTPLVPSVDEPASLGDTAATAVGGPGNGTQSFPTGNGSAAAWSFAGWETGAARNENVYFQFRVDLTHFGDFTLFFDDRASGTGPSLYDIRYSTDNGVNWTDVVVGASTHAAFTASPMNTYPLGVAAGSSDVIFQIYGYGASASTGTWRLDNVRIYATENANAVSLSGFQAQSPLLGLTTALMLAGGLVLLRKRS